MSDLENRLRELRDLVGAALESSRRASGDASARALQSALDVSNAAISSLAAAPVILASSDPAYPSGVVLTGGTDISIVGGVVSAGSGLVRLSGLLDVVNFTAAGTWSKPTNKTLTFLFGNNSGTLTLNATSFLTSVLASSVSVTTPVPGTNYRFNGVTVTTPQLTVISL